MINIKRTGRGYRLSAETLLSAGKREVFGFFSDAMNLSRLTPPFLHFQVLSPAPIDMRVGTTIDYRLRLHGVPIRWQSKISRWEPDDAFVDEQVIGPYRRWHHEHTFAERDGKTLAADVVDFDVPGGGLTHRLFVRGQLRRIFEYRRRIMLEVFG